MKRFFSSSQINDFNHIYFYLYKTEVLLVENRMLLVEYLASTDSIKNPKAAPSNGSSKLISFSNCIAKYAAGKTVALVGISIVKHKSILSK